MEKQENVEKFAAANKMAKEMSLNDPKVSLMLEFLCRIGCIEGLHTLRNRGLKFSNYRLEKPVLTGNIEVIKFLESVGYNIGMQLVENFKKIVKNNHLEVIDYVLEKFPDMKGKLIEYYHQSCLEGDIEKVKYFLSKGVEVSSKKELGFKYACISGNLELVNLLVDLNCDIHVDNDDAMKHATEFGKREVVEKLFELGLDIEVAIKNTKDIEDKVYFNSLKLKKTLEENLKTNQSINTTKKI